MLARARARGAGRAGGLAGRRLAAEPAAAAGGWPAERVPGVEGAAVAMLPP